jgi:PAS domain S-box-containing protein
MITIGFLCNSITFIYLIIGYQHTESGNIFLNGLFGWGATPLILAIFLILNVKIYHLEAKINKIFNVFIILIPVTFILFGFVLAETTFFSFYTSFLSISIIILSLFLIIKYKDLTSFFFLLSQIFFTIAGLTIGLINNGILITSEYVPIISFFCGFVFLYTIFNLPSNTGKQNSIETVFNLQKELKQSEKQRKEYISRYNAIFNNHTDMIFTYDFSGNFIDANDASLKITGYSKEEISSINLRNLLDKGQLLKAFQLIREIKKIGYMKKPEEYILKCKNGELKVVEVISSLVYDDKNAIALQGIARDITDKKKAFTELKNQKKFEILRANIWKKSYDIENEHELIKMLMNELSTTINFDHSSFISINYDKETAQCIIGWDKTHKNDYGLGEGIPFFLMKHSFGNKIIKFSLNDIPIYAKPFVIPLLRKYPSKSSLMIPYGDIDKPLGYLTIEDYKNKNRIWTKDEENILLEVFNILNLKVKQIEANNEIRGANEQLEEINKNLEDMVADRTEEIKQLLTNKDEFINQLGHDLKNPLGPLIQLLPILEKQETNPKKKEIITVMKRNSEYMKNLVTKTIELAKLNSPNTRFHFQQMNLHEFVEKVIDTNTLLFNQKNIKVYNKIPKNTTLKADNLRIEELLTNLLNNSVKYSNNNDIIRINAIIKNNMITVSIKDTGIGMNESQLNNIFNEFYKADESRHDFESSGLGMTICKRIIEKHGGNMWVESEGIGKGTTFYFALPVNYDDEKDLNKESDSFNDIREKIDGLIVNK